MADTHDKAYWKGMYDDALDAWEIEIRIRQKRDARIATLTEALRGLEAEYLKHMPPASALHPDLWVALMEALAALEADDD